MSIVIPHEQIEQTIFLIRGHRVMLSTDLAELYMVEPRVLMQAVKRNKDRFPADFMFQLTEPEFHHLKSQFVISSWGGLRRAYPYAFTEQGVAMLSSVLRSKRAIPSQYRHYAGVCSASRDDRREQSIGEAPERTGKEI